MEWGLKNRLSRVIKPEDGRTVMLAIDHGSDGSSVDVLLEGLPGRACGPAEDPRGADRSEEDALVGAVSAA